MNMREMQEAYDYRAEPEGNEGDEILAAIQQAEEYLGRAERAVKMGDFDAARDFLCSAASELENEAGDA